MFTGFYNILIQSFQNITAADIIRVLGQELPSESINVFYQILFK